jgi:REP element-mobilizing transposase RayT
MEKSRHAVHDCGYHIVLRASFDRDIFTLPPVAGRGDIASDILDTVSGVALPGVELITAKVFGHAMYINVKISPDTGVKTYVDRVKRKTARMLKDSYPLFTTRVSSVWSRTHYVWTEGSVDMDEIFSYATAIKGDKDEK